MTSINKLRNAIPSFSKPVVAPVTVDSIIAPITAQINALDKLIADSWTREDAIVLEKAELRERIEALNNLEIAEQETRERARQVMGNLTYIVYGGNGQPT